MSNSSLPRIAIIPSQREPRTIQTAGQNPEIKSRKAKLHESKGWVFLFPRIVKLAVTLHNHSQIKSKSLLTKSKDETEVTRIPEKSDITYLQNQYNYQADK